MAHKLDRITVNPAIMNGQPCIRGMRFTVRRVVEAAALYPDRNELKAEYAELDDEDIAQALDFLKERGVPLNYSASALEADAATLEKILPRS